MSVVIRTTEDWRALSAADAPIATFGSADIAAAWVEAEGSRYPGFRVVRVRTRVTEEVVFEATAAAA